MTTLRYTLYLYLVLLTGFLFVADACGREDGGNEGEFLADIVGDAKAAGSSNDQASFKYNFKASRLINLAILDFMFHHG